MGLKDLLTREFKIGSHRHQWREPACYRIRLRNDLWQRLFLVAGAWLIGTGVMFIVTSTNQNPPGPGLCLGLGAVFGLGPAILFLFFREHLTSGTVWLYDDHIRFQQMAFGFGHGIMIWAEWRYPQIERALFVSSERLGKSFHVLLLKIGSDWQMLGVPQKKLKEVRTFLERTGVELGPSKSIPPELCRGISWGPAISGAVVGIGILAVGILMAPDRKENRQRLRPEFAQQQPDLVQQQNPIVPNPLENLPFSEPSDQHDSSDSTTTSPQFPTLPGRFGPAGVRPFHAPGPGNNETNPTELIRTELVGGSGGTAFQTYSSSGKPVVAIGYRLGEWAGKSRIAQLIPMFDRASVNPDDPNVVIAREGYVLTGLHVDADSLVNAVAFIFARVSPDGSVDPSDTYTSPWVGTQSSSDKQLLGSKNSIAIGLHGRGAAVLDAIGLVLTR
ncbi:MAG TPA: hypothetical protein VLA12_14580 [Planctomycetaceae bacterium]|nr:hypothetical protein [Planctomycetaceae bacterium]